MSTLDINSFKKLTRWVFNSGKGYTLELTHHIDTQTAHEPFPSAERGPNRWCIYLQLASARLNLETLPTDELSSLAALLPFHGGCTYLKLHSKENWKKEPVYFIKLGCDYNHLYDTYYTLHALEEQINPS
jgi:hypothetical protein